MSFSGDVKEELSKINNLAHKDQVVAELCGYMDTVNTIVEGKKIRFSTESQYNINRYSKLLRNIQIDYDIDIQGKVFSITFKPNQFIKNKIKISTELEKRSYIRGVFLGAGSLNNPNNTYHLEIILKDKETAEKIIEILEEFGINSKSLDRKKGCSIYMKDGEEISKLLAFMGANQAVIKFEEIRVVKETRNNINRIVNCETANLNKTINASVEQINAINKLIQQDELKRLSKGLQEIAMLRIENPEASLIDLGRMLETPIGKSGVNHRLKRIVEIAKETK